MEFASPKEMGSYIDTNTQMPNWEPKEHASALPKKGANNKERPIGVAILIVLFGIGGFVELLELFISGTTTSISVLSTILAAWGAGLGGIAVLVLMVGIGIGIVLPCAISYGLFFAKKWAWWLTVVALAFGLLFELLSVSPILLVGALLDAALIYYMTRRGILDYFGVKLF